MTKPDYPSWSTFLPFRSKETLMVLSCFNDPTSYPIPEVCYLEKRNPGLPPLFRLRALLPYSGLEAEVAIMCSFTRDYGVM